MKFITICCILVLALAAPLASAEGQSLTILQKIVLKVWRAECRWKTGASLSDQEAIHEGKFTEATPIQKCFVGCMMQKAGFFDKDGNIQYEYVQEQFSKMFGTEVATTVNNACNGLKGKNLCETATLIYQCHYNYHIAMLI